jgi:hypothetical protein
MILVKLIGGYGPRGKFFINEERRKRRQKKRKRTDLAFQALRLANLIDAHHRRVANMVQDRVKDLLRGSPTQEEYNIRISLFAGSK